MEDDTKTKHQSYAGAYSQESVSGFALYESAVSFLKNLGVKESDIFKMPEILLTSVGSILKQVDDLNQELDALNQSTALDRQTISRLRAQRNALRGMFERMRHDPMPGYQSDGKLRALPPEDNM